MVVKAMMAIMMTGIIIKIWKQSFIDVLQNKSSLKFRKFHRKTPVLELLFNKDGVSLLKTDSNTGVFL